MKAVAVVLKDQSKDHKVEILDVPEPSVGSPTQVKVRTLEVGVCGTDAEVMRGEHGRPPEGESHLIVGHECLGEVVEVGGAVKHLKVGDLVVPRVRHPCPVPECTPCREGHTDFCVTGQYTERGIQGAHGFCVEYFVEEEAFLHRVPRELRPVAVLTEPLTIAEKSLRQVELIQRRVPWKPQRPLKAVVLGAGPVGLLGAMVLMRLGYQTTMYSHTAKPNKKAELTEAIGVPYVSSEEEDVVALVKQHGRADVVYEAAGVASAAFNLVEALAPNGVFVFTGVPPGAKREVDEGALMKRMVLDNQVLLGTVNASAVDFGAALESLAHFQKHWPGELESLITARHPPEEYAAVVGGDRSHGVKDVIVFTGSGAADA